MRTLGDLLVGLRGYVCSDLGDEICGVRSMLLEHGRTSSPIEYNTWALGSELENPADQGGNAVSAVGAQ